MPDLEPPSLDRAGLAILLPDMAQGRRSFAELRQVKVTEPIKNHLGYQRMQDIEKHAPARLPVASGSSVRLQEVFGLETTPRVAGGRVPVRMELLGPNNRPVQVTQDLTSLWDGTCWAARASGQVSAPLVARRPARGPGGAGADPQAAALSRRPDSKAPTTTAGNRAALTCRSAARARRSWASYGIMHNAARASLRPETSRLDKPPLAARRHLAWLATPALLVVLAAPRPILADDSKLPVYGHVSLGFGKNVLFGATRDTFRDALGGGFTPGLGPNLAAGFSVAPASLMGLGLGLRIRGSFGTPEKGDNGDDYVFNHYNLALTATYYPISRAFDDGLYVRLAAPPVVAELLVVPLLPVLLTRYPKLRLALDATTTLVDLARRDADLALRPSKPDHGDLACRKLVDSTYAAFASPQLAALLGTIAHLDAAPWVGWTADLAEIPAARWAGVHLDDARVVLRAGALTTHLAAAHASVGVAILPGPVGVAQGLVRLRAQGDAAARLAQLPTESLWLVAHRALRDVPRVAAVWDFLLERASPLRDAAREAEESAGA